MKRRCQEQEMQEKQGPKKNDAKSKRWTRQITTLGKDMSKVAKERGVTVSRDREKMFTVGT